MDNNYSIKAVDVFCGAGGLSHGLLKAGLNVIAGYDIEESCRFAFEHNNDALFINKDVTFLSGQEVSEHLKDASFTVLAGCAPCQPFSTYSRTKQKSGGKDSRWNLLATFGRLVAEVRPDFVTVENVPGIATEKVFRDFLLLLEDNQYQIDYKTIYCPDYGMAQTRKRLVLLASRLGSVKLIKPTHTESNYVTVKDVIGHLPAIRAGETDKDDELHRASILSPINLKRIIASRPGGTWLDWPEELRADCHRKVSGVTYPSVYGRMSWDGQAPTITTQCNGYGNGRFGHPEQNRAISLREAAMLQSFPQDYKFYPASSNAGIAAVAKMIGNAVPVRLGEVVGQSIKLVINNYKKLATDSLSIPPR